MFQNAQSFTDSTGQQFIVLDAISPPPEPKNHETLKNNIFAVKEITQFISSSFGPRGRDKLLVDEDGEITLTNDGATILRKSGLKSPMGKLILGLSQAQDLKSGDGTTGVVLLCSSILSQSLELIEKDVHPALIEKVIGDCALICEKAIEDSSIDIKSNNSIYSAIETTLRTKIAKDIGSLDSLIKTSFELAERNILPNMIKYEKRISKNSIAKAKLIEGFILKKEFYNPSMPKHIKNAKIIILSFPIEPPKPKVKHSLLVRTDNEYFEASKYEEDFFNGIVNDIKQTGANVVICQWGFDEEAGYLLMEKEISAITWIDGKTLEMISLSTGAEIICRREDILNARLGECGEVQELNDFVLDSLDLGELSLTKIEQDEKMILIDKCKNSYSATVLISAGSNTVIDELKRSLDDAVGVARILKNTDSKMVCGGGAIEIECARLILEHSQKIKGTEKIIFEKFANALYEIPRILARNSEFNEEIELKKGINLNKTAQKAIYGINCKENGSNNMLEEKIYEPLESKKNQIMTSIEIARMILRIDDVIAK